MRFDLQKQRAFSLWLLGVVRAEAEFAEVPRKADYGRTHPSASPQDVRRSLLRVTEPSPNDATDADIVNWVGA